MAKAILPEEWSFKDWQARMFVLMDEFVSQPGSSIGKFQWHRDATDDRYGFKIAFVWPGQQSKRRKKS